MATFAELRTYVEQIIQDTSLNSMIGTYLNQGVIEIAGGMQSALGDWITPPLPELLTIDTITTDTSLAYVSMPTNFQRELQFVANPNGAEIDIEENFILFSETYPLLDQSGSVSAVIEKGNKLYYQGIPTSETDLTIHYYRYPVEMDNITDEPDGIPKHLQRSLLVNYTAWKIFELIEDGIDGPGSNTERYRNLFFQALKVLELTVPYPTRGIDLIND